MNESQRISDIVFVTRLGYVADAGELMDRLHGLCRLELRSVLDPERWSIRRIGSIHHRQLQGAAVALEARGWVERLGDDEVTFRVVAFADGKELVDCSIALGMVARERASLRIVSSTAGPAGREAIDEGEWLRRGGSAR
jgi:hypothetical protein